MSCPSSVPPFPSLQSPLWVSHVMPLVDIRSLIQCSLLSKLFTSTIYLNELSWKYLQIEIDYQKVPTKGTSVEFLLDKLEHYVEKLTETLQRKDQRARIAVNELVFKFTPPMLSNFNVQTM